MKNRISYHNLRELAIETSYPVGFDSKEEVVVERTYVTDKILGKGYYKELYFKGVHIGYGDISLANTILLDFECDFETVEMHFGFSNTITNSNDFKNGIEFKNNQHNIIYINGFKGVAQWAGDAPMKIFEVNLLPSFFQKYIPDHAVFESFKQELQNKASSILSKHNFPITPRMMILINRIMSCDRKGVFKQMFLEAHVIELLMLQLEQITEHDCTLFCSFKKHDMDKIYEVKDIISNRLNEPCSLIGLAHEVGTNEFTLKKGFKELFGTTVFGYWNDLKMERAQTMLAEEGMTVTEVSEKIGYRNPQHFSTAFKRRFGYSPSKIKT